MKTKLRNFPVVSVSTALLPLTVAAQGQETTSPGGSAQSAKPAAVSNGDEYPDIIELDPFRGVSLFGQVTRGLGEKLVTGGTAGGRAAWNFNEHVGLELSYNYMVNNVRLVTPFSPGLPSYNFGQRIYYPALNVVYNLTRRGSRVQPYLTVGGGGAQFTPTSKAQAYARTPSVDAIYHSAAFNDNLQAALNYGGGIKVHLSDHFGVRFDVRGFSQATASACGGNLTYKWTVSEGTVTNDSSATANLDGSSLNFEGGGQAKTKSVTATLTATDEGGQSVFQTTSITVNYPPQFKRLPDIVFSKNKARMNNRGKRILIDQAGPQASTTYDVVLVGHRAADETSASAAGTGQGRRAKGAGPARSLDEQRALNAVAVLTGGGGICASLDPAQVRFDWVGTDSTSTPDPGLCGTSNLPATKERRGSQVSNADKDRRVEVYLVPRNSQAMPPAVKNAKQLPEAEIKALGCPR